MILIVIFLFLIRHNSMGPMRFKKSHVSSHVWSISYSSTSWAYIPPSICWPVWLIFVCSLNFSCGELKITNLVYGSLVLTTKLTQTHGPFFAFGNISAFTFMIWFSITDLLSSQDSWMKKKFVDKVISAIRIYHLTCCGLVLQYSDMNLSTLAQAIAWCLTTPSHYLNQCWPLIS